MARACALAAAVSLAPLASASGLQVSPIGLSLASTAQADALWLTNTGSEPVHAQVRVFRWSQADGKDVLEPSRDLVVSPPMVTIAPGDRQMVRVIRQVPAPARTEASYRVIVDELPIDAGDRPGLTFVLRYSVPVFLAPAGDPAVKAALQASWEHSPDGPILRVGNAGNGHAQIADLVWRGANGQHTILLGGLLGYALPGSTMSWHLPQGATHAGGSIKARINGETSESTLVVDTDGR
ncbi:MAG TPA: molecular chaperone [Luteibacter sp.]|uniref:fimbrial biogenesis chaperone n=1 Tax=Luteibacter sp. TaxID=1886636 RepID=UPI002C114771|nr:molecular chaperone [Luteibacter sp.]HVI56923.1 molecular chaperone [Luteibacter sp.]